MKYYEIVRFADQWPEMEEFQTVQKMVRRGWKKKAIAFMAEWDYGGENIDAARVYNRLWSTPTDPQNQHDRVIYENDTYWLCCSECPSGLYSAYYLVGCVNENEL